MELSPAFRQQFFYLVNKGVANLTIRLVKSTKKNGLNYAIIGLLNIIAGKKTTELVSFYSLDRLILNLQAFIESHNAALEESLNNLRYIDNGIYKLNSKTRVRGSGSEAFSDGCTFGNGLPKAVSGSIEWV